MTSPDLVPLLMGQGSPDVGFHTGEVVAWDADAGTNTVKVLGESMTNLKIMVSAGIADLAAGMTVGVLRYKSTYFILGRIVTQDSGFVNPQIPIMLYPQFTSNVAAGTSGTARVNSGVLVSWEGRFKPAFRRLEVDGIWGNLSGTGSTTYAIKLGGTTVGSWTSTTLDVSRQGPFDISAYLGQDWLKIELAITVSTGTGEKAVAPLGVYFR